MKYPFITPRDVLSAKIANEKERSIVDAALLGLCDTDYSSEELIAIKHELDTQYYAIHFKFVILCN